MKALTLGVLIVCGASSAFADLVAEYKLDHADSGAAEAGQVMDSAGDPPSDAERKVNYPFWANETDTGVSMPGDGRAVGMTMSNGHEFGDGAKGNLRFDKGGEFSIFARVFARAEGDFRIERAGVVELRFFNDQNNNTRSVAGTVTDEDGLENTVVFANPGTDNAWHDYALVFRPGEALEIYVDGSLVNTTTTKIQKLAHSDNPFRYMNYLTSSQFLESLRVYNHALTAAEVEQLSAR